MSFFFSLLDDSLRPLGSRDPLGIEMLWSRVGRRLVGNLTTVTAHLDNFIISLVGFHLCRNALTDQTDWAAFERFEQLTARARVAENLAVGVIGIRRIRKNQNFPIPLGSSQKAKILDDQRKAGLWGLYASALAETGLSDGNRRCTQRGTEIAEAFLQAAPENNEAWRIAIDKQVQKIDKEQLEQVCVWVSALLRDAQAPRNALSDCLLSGGQEKPDAWQPELLAQGRLFMKNSKEVPPARDFLAWLSAHSPALRDYTQWVLQFDQVLALATVTFNWLLGCHGRDRLTINEQMTVLKDWPFSSPPMPEFSEKVGNEEWHRRTQGLGNFCKAMQEQRWSDATELLLTHHAEVAKNRGGSPWCYWENNKIKVLMGNAPGILPLKDELVSGHFQEWMRWRSNGFFLDAFLSILHQTAPSKGGI